MKMEEKKRENAEFTIEGRNAVIEAFRSGRTIDRLYVLDGCKDGPVMTIKREAAKQEQSPAEEPAGQPEAEPEPAEAVPAGQDSGAEE